MSTFGYDSGNHLIYGTQDGKCFDTGKCEECNGNSGEDVVICLGSGEVVYPSDCPACTEECCGMRADAFKCDCGHVTKEE